ncbi:RNA polymerase sigma-70 factor [Carboxylicivirga marina]|uniref:RNA polymerase sigma-70 factor n=1 Tax=Carboxylicivirga marina TaxID=2800988 RepID=A0ABS1HEV5_9BACT|nr:RNA polymerase sigma-70 factor [Carboxylicivirga marina]MBK3516197.1 RNA polymerase sigma-70 factor [Carboxylicivirga marina]
MNPSERIILQAVESGDVTIYRELFSRYSKSLFYYACKFISEDEARDVVQEVFMALWQQRIDLNITTSLNSYLFGVTRNKCLKVIRQKAKNEQNELSIMEVEYFQDDDNSINSIIEQELSDTYKVALDKLPPKCLEVFLMSRNEELKNKEIAAQLNISEKAVEKHISKALKHLRTELKEYLPIFCYLSQFI